LDINDDQIHGDDEHRIQTTKSHKMKWGQVNWIVAKSRNGEIYKWLLYSFKI